MTVSGAAMQARIAAVCRADLDSRTLRAEVLTHIRRVVPFDSYAWLLTDPETRVGAAPLAQVPELAELPRLIRLKYCTPVNRWTALVADTCATLAVATGGDLARSRLWRELLQDHGVTDIASMAFRDQFGCWGFLDLWRSGGTPAQFSGEEQAFLSSLGPGLTAALRTGQAAVFAHPGPPASPFEGPAVLLLSAFLERIDQTPYADAQLRRLLPTAPDAEPIAAAALNVAAQLLAVELGVDGAPAMARAHLAGTQWISLRAARLGRLPADDQAPIVVTIEPILPQDRLELYCRTAGLTRREAELMRHLAHGSSTRQLAFQLTVSENTIQDHLKSIFAKTNSTSRSALVASALGTGPHN